MASFAVPSGVHARKLDQVTERSRKFYDGTYKWFSQGFQDEEGGTSALPSFAWDGYNGVQSITSSRIQRTIDHLRLYRHLSSARAIARVTILGFGPSGLSRRSYFNACTTPGVLTQFEAIKAVMIALRPRQCSSSNNSTGLKRPLLQF